LFKKYGYLFLSIIFLAGFIVLVLDPFRLSPYSYTALTDRQAEIETLKASYSSALREIPSLERAAEQKKREADAVRASYSSIEPGQLKEAPFHLPSILILLETEARKRNLEFRLFYDLIEPPDLRGGTVRKPDPEPESPDTAEEKTGPSFSLANLISGTVLGYSSSPHLLTAAVPVAVEGSFDRICSYIEYLDTTGWFVPFAVKITGSDPVKCEIIIKVYYTAEGGF
jgi:hypothetical protein